ncbi:MAG: hypothetical protein EU549_01095 [Promethearchaeota archaeon]|nr:MAG: hypothetical protein EU549_01095 [Candidatus Lokiarchaeota archaeon]
MSFKFKNEITDNPYSLIVDKENCKDLVAVTRKLEIGDIIEWIGKQYICIGSGDLLGKSNFNLQEIRAILLERMNINEVREVYKRLLRKEKIPIPDQEGLWIGKINSIYRPEGNNVDEDLIIFYLKFEDKENHKVVSIPAQFDHRNVKWIIGLDFDNPQSIINREVYILGYLSEKDGKIAGRAIMPVE